MGFLHIRGKSNRGIVLAIALGLAHAKHLFRLSEINEMNNGYDVDHFEVSKGVQVCVCSLTWD